MPTITFLNASGSTEYKDVDSGSGTSGDPYIDRNRAITGAALTALQLIDDIVHTDDAAFSIAVDKVAAIGALLDDTTPDAVDEGDIGAVRMSAYRELYVQLRDAAGNNRGLNIDASGNITVNLSATDNAVLDAIQAAVETIDNAISGTEMQVDIVTSALPTGAATAANQSTANTSLSNIETDTGNIDTSLNNIEAGYAADDAALGSGVLIQGDDGTDRKNINVDATTGDVQVDVTNTVTVDGSGVTQPISGTVTANLSATDNAVLDTIETNTDYGAVVGGGVEATALRVTLANDSTGVISVDDNAGSLTVDNADITTIAGAVSGTEMQVDVVGALPAGTNAIGKLAANSGVDIGDVDVLSVAAGENHLGEVGGNTLAVTINPTVSTTPAYTSGDSIGGKFTLANAVRVSGGKSVLLDIMLLGRANQKPTGQIIIFNADPTTATLTDNSAVSLSTDDQKVVVMIPVGSSDWVTINSKGYANLRNLGVVVQAASGTSLYAAFVTTSTPTFTATTDLQVIFKFLRD